MPVLSRPLVARRNGRAGHGTRHAAQLGHSTGRPRRWSGLDPQRRSVRSRPVPVQCHTRFGPQPDGPGPQSQSLSRSYGSILPTSLTYIVPSTRGCSPRRPAADMGTVRHENHTPSLGFSRAGGSAPDTARAAVLYARTIPISGRADSRDPRPYKEKTTLPGTAVDVSEFGCVAALGPEGPISASGFGNIDPIPFRSQPDITSY